MIRTRYFLEALTRLKPHPLAELLEKLPSDALPKPLSDDINVNELVLQNNPKLSACVEDSLINLSKQASSERKLSTTDVFVDIIRHGTGESVAHLKTHGITAEKVDLIIRQLGWNIIERKTETRVNK